MKVTSEARVYVLGAALCLALTICARNFGDKRWTLLHGVLDACRASRTS